MRGRPGARVGELARHWFAATQPIDLAKAIDYSRQAGDAALAALAPADALRYYAQALDLYPQATTPIRSWASTWPSGSAPPSARPGTRPFARPSSGRRRAADLGDTERLVAAALANNRGFFSAVGAIDAEKVEVLELALDRLPTRSTPIGHSCSPPSAGAYRREPARAPAGPGRRGRGHCRVLR